MRPMEKQLSGLVGTLLIVLLVVFGIIIGIMRGSVPLVPGKAALVISMEDTEVAEKILAQRSFRILRQGDISR